MDGRDDQGGGMSGQRSGTRHGYSVLGDFDVPYVDASVPNVARIYDYMLGGKDNYAADREAAASLMRVVPDVLQACRDNREFLGRAVRFLAGEAGIGQFIDIGTGLPTQGSVHQAAQDIMPGARVVYADYDPVVVSHANALLTANPHVAVINGDLTRPQEILDDPVLRACISRDEPVAVLLLAVLHFIPDQDDPWAVTRTLMTAMPPGSYLVLSHITDDKVSPEASGKAQDVYASASASATPRPHDAITRLFSGLEILEPGVTDIRRWRPAGPPPKDGRVLLYGGVARTPGCA